MISKSSKKIILALPLEMEEMLSSYAQKKNLGKQYIIREAIIKYFSEIGIDTSSLTNPRGQGERSDLKHFATPEEKKQLAKELAERFKKKK